MAIYFCDRSYPNENFLMRLAIDVENAAIVARNLVQLYDTPR